jgi:hypothetical protein
MKKSPITRVNAARAKRRRVQKFGPPGYRAFVVSRGCIVGNARGYTKGCSRKIDFAHGHGKDGQDWRSGFGCCADHHTLGGDSFHTLGHFSFAVFHGVIPATVAQQNVGIWESMTTEQRQAWERHEETT